MNLQSAIKKIDKSLDSSASTPIIVDVPSASVFNAIKTKYSIGSNVFVAASKFCGKDTIPAMDKLENDICKLKKRVFLTELSSFLKLLGEQEANKTLLSLLDLQLDGKVVILTYQAKQILKFSDPRLSASGRVISIDTQEATQIPTLLFVAPELADSFEQYADGLRCLPPYVENGSYSDICIITKRKKWEFPNSIYDIKPYSSAYEILCASTVEIKSLDKSFGTDEQWASLNGRIAEYGNWSELVLKEFGGTENLVQNLGNFQGYPTEKKWEYFIALRINGCGSNTYLSNVVSSASNINDFYDGIYTEILKYEPKSKSFKQLYDERRDILKKIEFPISTVSNFCKQVVGKAKNALHYLTDSTQQEKELIIEQICKYPDAYNNKELGSILSRIYPDLAVYLSYFNYSQPLLSEYFNAYKYCKITNRLLPEFMSMVEEQSVKREYNTILQPRAAVLSKADLTGTKLYFVDALGVEFLSIIQDRLFRKNLDYKASFARCDLPSITSMNKDFVDEFKKAGCKVADIKKLDELKHSDTSKYNYEYTKLPIHIIEEFSIIDDVINNIEQDLYSGDVKRVYVVSDHGASRLAVINETVNKWEISEKGEHSGRCCLVSDIDEKPEFATEENNFWCLANYDRFKGGRRANVEVHGGASLEEVVIPIIEIKKAGDKPKCQIDDNFKVVTASYKVDAMIRLFISKDLKHVKVCLNGQFFDAVHSEQKYYYDVVLPKVRKGKYTIDVYDDNALIAQGLSFEIKSAGATENKYF